MERFTQIVSVMVFVLLVNAVAACQRPTTEQIEPDATPPSALASPMQAAAGGPSVSPGEQITESSTETPSPSHASPGPGLTGGLLLADNTGFRLYSFDSQKVHSLLTVPRDAGSPSIATSPNRERVAFATSPVEGSVKLWLIDGMHWQPEPVIEVALAEQETESASLRMKWLSNRYVVVEILSDLSTNVPTRSLLVDADRSAVEIEQPGSLLLGCALAHSTRSGSIAIWCPLASTELSSTSEERFVVIDGDETLWETSQLPLEQPITMADRLLWTWSGDGAHVAFPVVGGFGTNHPAILDIEDDLVENISEDGAEPRFSNTIVIADRNAERFVRIGTLSYSVSLDAYGETWSPDGHFLAFVDDCPEMTLQCLKVADVVLGEVAWTSAGMPDLSFWEGVVWAPDSTHIAIKAQNDRMVVINVLTGDVVASEERLSGWPVRWLPEQQ